MRKILLYILLLGSLGAGAQYPLGPQSKYPIVRQGIQIGPDTLVTQTKWAQLWALAQEGAGLPTIVTTLDGTVTHDQLASARAILDYAAAIGGGDMLKDIYDANNNGIVDNSELLNGQAASYYLSLSNATGALPISQVTALQAALDAKLATSTAASTYQLLSNLSTSTSLGSSNSLYPSQLAVKTYVDNAVSGITVTTDATIINGSTNPVQGNAVFDALALKANLASPTFTGTAVLPSSTSIGTITSTELSYVDGVTSSIQTQLNSKLSANQAITLGGDLTGSGTTSITAIIASGAVSLGKLAPIAQNTFLGRTSLGSGSVEALSVSQMQEVLQIDEMLHTISVNTDSTQLYFHRLNGLVDTIDFVGASDLVDGAGLTNGDKGDIIVASSGESLTIDAGVVTSAMLAGNIDATKIADGSISNTEFQYLNNVGSNIQTQIDAKAPTNNPTFTGVVNINTSAASGSREIIIKGGVPNSTSDMFIIGNGTSDNGSFAPLLGGLLTTSTTHGSLHLYGFATSTTDATDASQGGLVTITALRTTSVSDPLNGTLTEIQNRKILTVGTFDGVNHDVYIQVNAAGESLFGLAMTDQGDYKIQSSGSILSMGALESSSATGSLILKSPNGTRWRITIGNTGTLTSTPL